MNQERLFINVRKRNVFEWLTIWMVLLPLFWGVLFDILNIPGAVKYTADIAWLILLFAMLIRRKTKVGRVTLPLLLLVLLFFIYSLVVYLFEFQSPLYFLWGIRNNFRYYVFFFAIISYFKEYDLKSLLKLFEIAFWINAFLVFVQFFGFGYKGDYLGGIFGVQKGCNGYMVIFLTIVVGYSLLLYMNRKESLRLCFSKVFFSLFISALAELKVFFILFVLILLMASLFTKFSWKKVLVIVFTALILYLCVTFMVYIFESDEILTLEGIWKLATQENYSSGDTVNRLSAIPTLSKSLLKESHERIFGLGIGNCSTSTFDFLNTPFYERYSYLRYSWFSCANLFLEVGYLGLMMYITFFVICFILIRRQKNNGNVNPVTCQMGMIMAVVSIVTVFYNASLHSEAGYMVYLFLALPFISPTTTNAE